MFDEGFFDYSQSLLFSGECLGQTGGLRQAANLGDGNGMREVVSRVEWVAAPRES
mgnify:FL=1